MKNETLLPVLQVLLLLNFLVGFFFNKSGQLFGDMFYTNSLIVLEKNILNLGVYLISLLCADWLKKTPHLPEFFMLMLSALLGMFFMISGFVPPSAGGRMAPNASALTMIFGASAIAIDLVIAASADLLMVYGPFTSEEVPKKQRYSSDNDTYTAGLHNGQITSPVFSSIT